MSENSFIAILNRMKSRITTEADRREGTWTADNLQAVANELARVYAEDIEDILPQAFVATAVGKNLDSACSDYGITRREATKAETVVEVTGDPGNYSGVTGYAGEIAFLLDDFVIEGAGAVQVRAVCMTAGEQGNVAAGSITEADSIHIRKITNPEDAEGDMIGKAITSCGRGRWSISVPQRSAATLPTISSGQRKSPAYIR